MENALSQIDPLARHHKTKMLQKLLDRWAVMPIFSACANPIVASQLIALSLWHTYLFGRFTLPRYIGHSFLALSALPPAEGQVARAIRGLLSVAEGELATNNIVGGSIYHAHYHDMRAVSVQAGGSVADIEAFERDERGVGLFKAMLSSALWSSEMCRYARLLERVTRQPLVSWLIALVSEETIPRGYQVILDHLPPVEEFRAYRTFLARHIELDQGEHGPSTIEWVELCLAQGEYNSQEIDDAINLTIRFVEARISTYRYQDG